MKKANEKYCYELIINLRANSLHKLWTFAEFYPEDQGAFIRHRADGPVASYNNSDSSYSYIICGGSHHSIESFQKDSFHNLSRMDKVKCLKVKLAKYGH